MTARVGVRAPRWCAYGAFAVVALLAACTATPSAPDNGTPRSTAQTQQTQKAGKPSTTGSTPLGSAGETRVEVVIEAQPPDGTELASAVRSRWAAAMRTRTSAISGAVVDELPPDSLRLSAPGSDVGVFDRYLQSARLNIRPVLAQWANPQLASANDAVDPSDAAPSEPAPGTGAGATINEVSDLSAFPADSNPAVPTQPSSNDAATIEAWQTAAMTYGQSPGTGPSCAQIDRFLSLDDPDLPLLACDHDGVNVYLLDKTLIPGTELKGATATDGNDGWAVTVDFKSDGYNTWSAYTTSHVGMPTAFTFDGQVLVAPVISQPVTTLSTVISNGQSEAPAADLAGWLNFGALPLAFDVTAKSVITGDQASAPQDEPNPGQPFSTAFMSPAIDGAVSYSEDGTIVATVPKDRRSVCWGATQEQRTTDRCAAIPAPIGYVSVAPDGQTIAVAEDKNQTYQSHLWFLQTETGELLDVPSESACPDPGEKSDAFYVGITWISDSNALTTDYQNKDLCFAQTSPAQLKPRLIASIPGTAVTPLASPVANDSTAVLPVSVAEDLRIAVVDLVSGAIRMVPIDPSTVGLRHANAIVPLAISPDGSSALIYLTDSETYSSVPLARVDLSSGALSEFTGITDLGVQGSAFPALGATYSPDGSEIAAFMSPSVDQVVLVMASQVGGQVTKVSDFQGAAASQVELRWSTNNLLTPTVNTGAAGDLGVLAPCAVN